MALGKSWHPEEFNCAHCKNTMAYIGFVEEKGALYCELCYEKFFAPECGRCQRKILGVSVWNYLFLCSASESHGDFVINLSIIFTLYFLLALSTLAAFISCVYYKRKRSRPLRRYIRPMGLAAFGLVWWKSSHYGKNDLLWVCYLSRTLFAQEWRGRPGPHTQTLRTDTFAGLN